MTPGRHVGHMRGRLLLPAEAFGIGPGKVRARRRRSRLVTTRRGAIPTICPDIADALADVLVSSLDLLRTPTYSGPRVMHERPAEEGLAPSAGALPPTWRRLKPQVMAEQSVAMGKFRPVKVERQMEAGRKGQRTLARKPDSLSRYWLSRYPGGSPCGLPCGSAEWWSWPRKHPPRGF